jgi:hypothetical protein
MKVTMEELQFYLISNVITLEQFVQVIIDNYGEKKATEILINNLRLALSKETLQEQKHSLIL